MNITLPFDFDEIIYCIHDFKVKPCKITNYYIDKQGIMCDLLISQNDCSPNALNSVNIILQFTGCLNLYHSRDEALSVIKKNSNQEE